MPISGCLIEHNQTMNVADVLVSNDGVNKAFWSSITLEKQVGRCNGDTHWPVSGIAPALLLIYKLSLPSVTNYKFDKSRQCISSMTVEVDFLQKKNVDSNPYNSDHMAGEFIQHFNNQAFTVGQQVPRATARSESITLFIMGSYLISPDLATVVFLCLLAGV